MQHISNNRILLIFILIFSNHINHGDSIDIIDEKTSALIVHGSKCIMNVISNHFPIGTSIGLIRSGLQNYTTNKVIKYTPDATLMENPNWTVIIKQKIGYHMKKLVKFVFFLNLKFF